MLHQGHIPHLTTEILLLVLLQLTSTTVFHPLLLPCNNNQTSARVLCIYCNSVAVNITGFVVLYAYASDGGFSENLFHTDLWSVDIDVLWSSIVIVVIFV